MNSNSANTLRKPSFAVLGVGAVGGLYGGMLAKAGFEVHFLARSDYHQLKTAGLQVETPSGNFVIQPQVYDDVNQMPQVDCVIVAWKSTANANLARVLPHFQPSNPIILVLQNGLNVEQPAADLVDRSRILGGCCFLCCNRLGPGRIKHLDFGRIAIGSYDQRLSGQITEPMVQIGEALAQAGIDIQLATSLPEIRWKKLAWNIPFNGLSVVLNSDTAAIMGNPQSALLSEELMEEVVASAAACGIEIPRQHVEQMLNDTRVMVPYASSMLLDYQAARPMEVEAIFGNPLRAAQAAGYQPKRIEMLYRQLSFLNARIVLGTQKAEAVD
jgi:2-dehydropantoate 2-reductase